MTGEVPRPLSSGLELGTARAVLLARTALNVLVKQTPGTCLPPGRAPPVSGTIPGGLGDSSQGSGLPVLSPD